MQLLILSLACPTALHTLALLVKTLTIEEFREMIANAEGSGSVSFKEVKAEWAKQ